MPHLVNANEFVLLPDGLLDFGSAPCALQLPFLVCMGAMGTALVKRFGLLFLNAGHAQGEGQLAAVTYGQHGVVEASGGLNGDECYAKV